ncbi:hypothetical protein CGW93_00855 [candidate division bacterium WOR-3 4484_18]|uniref:Lipopolysaccharide assembly protein A domain-containing protein n=1 Tax=candidate division WOR-3 bacterium 4484_18 TaxID=2020626 RepID=A0A257LUV0_UNCW3|nr:MAG: hypothetical protein CGW93_00855 [candidate division bacterium WOR-3 4484_18]
MIFTCWLISPIVDITHLPLNSIAGGLMRIVALLILSLIYLLAIVVGAQNYHTTVTIRILTKQIPNIPVLYLVLIIVAAGMIFVFIPLIIDELHLRREISRLTKENTKLSQEIDSLRRSIIEPTDVGTET